MPGLNNLIQYCNCQRAKQAAEYIQVKTGGNDPTISKRMLYSQYIKSSRSRQVMYKDWEKIVQTGKVE